MGEILEEFGETQAKAQVLRRFEGSIIKAPLLRLY
jgi:hypothetical protein